MAVGTSTTRRWVRLPDGRERMLRDKMLVEVFGEENLQAFVEQRQVLESKQAALDELYDLRQQASRAFSVDLKWPDYTVAAAAGVLLGVANALFKTQSHTWVRHE